MPSLKTRIIRWTQLVLLAALAPLLTACSALRLAYSNGPTLAWWWLDGYVDFGREQAPAVKRALDDYFDWHRRTQLPDWVAWLAAAQAPLGENQSPAQMCRLYEQARALLEPSLQQALAAAADLVPGLGEAQFQALDKRYAKGDEEMRDDFLQPDATERLEASVQRARERAERVYGRLEDAQLRVLREGVAASPFNPELWLLERQRRQRDTLQTLRRLAAEQAGREQRVAALRALAERVERSPDAEYRAYQLKLVDYNCALAARLHNATTPRQRQKARDVVKGWENDLRAAMAAS